MGELLFRTNLSRSLFTGLALGWPVPGRLLHVNVIGCTIFAAISAHPPRPTQVVGRMALTELLKRGYSGTSRWARLPGPALWASSSPRRTSHHLWRAGGVLADVSIIKLFPRPASSTVCCLRLLHGLGHDPHHDPPRPRAGERAGASERVLGRALSPPSRISPRRCSSSPACSAPCMAASPRPPRQPQSESLARRSWPFPAFADDRRPRQIAIGSVVTAR